MKITVTTLSDEIFTLDVSEDLELENFKAFCEIESGVSASKLLVLHEGRPLLDDKKTLRQHGIRENDVVLLQEMHGVSSGASSAALASNVSAASSQDWLSSANSSTVSMGSGGFPNIDFGSIAIPGGPQSQNRPPSAIANSGTQPTSRREDDPAFIRDMIMANPDQLSLLKQNNPRLADALLSGDLAKFTAVLQEQQHERIERERMRIRMMNADPFDLEAQRLIADEIRLHNIESNMEAAMEYNPESFGQVVMLYVNCHVNGHPVKAFVDSGAQTTIVSQACAERCNIMRLVDTRWAGIAKGVGMQKIIGRVHLGQIQIEDVFLTSSFCILEDQPMDMLLGLDMLRRHQCCIDLKRNILTIGTTGTETPFLPDHDLPDCARLSMSQDALQRSVQEEDDKQLAEALNRSKDDSQGASSSRTNAYSTDVAESTTSSSTNILPSDRFTEGDVQRIVSMGFSRQLVVEALRKFSGDSTQAIASLFAKSLKF